MASASQVAYSMNIVLSSAIKGSNFLQASTKGIHTYAKKVENINLLRATKFPLLKKHLTSLDNHLAHIKKKALIISANPIKLDIKTSRDSLKEARKDMTAIEHDAKQVAFWTKKSAENLERGVRAYRQTTERKKPEIGVGAVGAAVAVGSAIAFPIKASIEFESAMADVNKVVDMTKQESERFQKELWNLTHTIPLTAVQLSAIAASGGQLGITKDKIIGFTEIVAKMSTAFDMSAGDAGESIAKLMNVYGGGVVGAKKLGDAINYLSNKSAAKASDIVNVLGRIGGNAKALNMTSIQAANLASAFLALGKPPEVAATAINSMLGKFGNIEGQSKKFKEALQIMGIDGAVFQEQIRSHPQKAISEFLEMLHSMDKSLQSKISYDMFGQEFGDDILLLSSGVEHYRKAIKSTAIEKNYLKSMEREFQARADTTENKLRDRPTFCVSQISPHSHIEL